jgi:urease accessory protein
MKRWLCALRLASLAGLAVALSPSKAAAHPGAHHLGSGESFFDGFLHPVLGADHLVAMLAIGLWAAYLGGRALVSVPLAFAGMMALGAMLGAGGVPLPGVEQTIAVSLVVFGLMICMLAKLPALLASALVGLFAIFHGYAHGAETPDLAQPLLYGAGFVMATVLLLGAGVAIGETCRRSAPDILVRGAGAAVAVLGIVTVIGHI